MDGKVCCLPRVLQYQYERGKISCRRLEWEGGAVSSRVALLLRSAEAQPYLPRFVRFSELFFFLLLLLFLYVLNVKPDVCLVYFTRVCVCGFWPGGQGKKNLAAAFFDFFSMPVPLPKAKSLAGTAPGSRLPAPSFLFHLFPPSIFCGFRCSIFFFMPARCTHKQHRLSRTKQPLPFRVRVFAGRRPQAASRKPACAKKC